MEKKPQNKKKPSRKRVETPFAKNLQLILEERRLTQKAAGEICGVAQSVINGWLQGDAPADLIAVQRLATALNVSFEWLLTGSKTSIPPEELSMAELFEEKDAAFSGLFRIEAKRLVRRGEK